MAEPKTPAPVSAQAINSNELVDGWASDLIGNISALRETDNYNAFRAALAELKQKLQPV